MKKVLAVAILAGLLTIPFAAVVSGQGGPVMNPANGHYYELVNQNSTWLEARDAAEARSYICRSGQINGHLATITSAEENLFVSELLDGVRASEALLGGFQDPPTTADPAANWHWVTGEPWGYTNWRLNEPNDSNTGEFRLEFNPGGRDLPPGRPDPNQNEDGRTWNDIPDLVNGQPLARRWFVVEYDCPLDSDGDGVSDDADYCPATVIPESVPTESLGVNRWALVDDDGVFDTTPPNGEGPGRSYSIADTAGCSCEQIIEQMDLGKGHIKFGCSISAMDEWISYVSTP